MSLGIWEFDILETGPVSPVGNVTVTVTEEETNDLADIFSDSGGATQLSNPKTFNDQTIKFYARTDRTYKLEIQSSGLARTLRNQSVSQVTKETKLMSEQSIANNGQITLDNLINNYVIPLKSNGGEVDINNQPFGDLTNHNVKNITILGVDNADFVKMNDANPAVDWSLVLNGEFKTKDFRILKLYVDQTRKRLTEIGRNL